MKVIQNQNFDQERAFYGSRDIKVIDCKFDGEADGESAFKESINVEAENCFFNLRYPFWHDDAVLINNCDMTSLCRAALWYSDNIVVKNTLMHGIKALRECKNVYLENVDIDSTEFGWLSKKIKMVSSAAQGEYFMLGSEYLDLCDIKFKGKYSFQYIKNAIPHETGSPKINALEPYNKHSKFIIRLNPFCSIPTDLSIANSRRRR